jgi:hypothetical protein
MYICSYIHLFLPRFGAYPNHTHIKVIVKKQLVGGEKRKRKTREKKSNSTDRD